jgi:hypothetical protein
MASGEWGLGIGEWRMENCRASILLFPFDSKQTHSLLATRHSPLKKKAGVDSSTPAFQYFVISTYLAISILFTTLSPPLVARTK